MAEQTTQSAYPWRASLRTGGSVAIAGLAAAAAIGPEVADFVSTQFPGSPAEAIVLSAVGIIAAASVAVNRIVLLGPVATFLQKIGLGPAPKESA